MKHFLRTTTDNITTLTFDRQNSSANIFDREALEELVEELEIIAKLQVSAVIFDSAKKGIFIAGADIHSLANSSESELDQLISLGQHAFSLIKQLPQRTVAAIDGACVGGGFELALACDYRVASDCNKTKIGLPETQLGILPAWGGSTRLPALIGLHKALPLILSGKLLGAKAAKKKGLIHAYCPAQNLKLLAEEFAKRPKPKTNKFTLYNNYFTSLIIQKKATSDVYKSTRGHYPALLEAIKVVCSSVRHSEQESLKQERLAIGRLAHSTTTKELIRLFFQTEAAKKRTVPNKKPAKVSSIAVIGAGVMGAGITYWLSNRGHPTLMQDINSSAIARGMHQIEKSYQQASKRKIISPTEAQAGLDRIIASSETLDLKDYDLVIEAAVEDLELKQKIFKDLSKRTSPDTILATNTSALPIHHLASVIENPSRLVGIHFFNPVARMKLVEIVTTSQTSPETIATTLKFVQSIGKLPVIVKDSPGFIVNRILVPYMIEAGNLFSQGVPAEDIDNAMLEFGMPMGPIRLLDKVGLDVASHVASTLAEAFPDRMSQPPVLKHMISKGMLGRKSGKGFYLYQQNKVSPNPKAIELQEPSKRVSNLASHLAKIMSKEARLCLDEGIAASAEEIDFAMVMGTGYAPFRGGPLRYADSVSMFSTRCYKQ